MYSKIIRNIPEALSIYFNQIVYDLKAKGVDIITLSLGEAYFDIPLYDFNKLDLEKCHHYSDSRGSLKLRQKICDYYFKNYDAKINFKDEILISAGSKPLIYMALLTILNKNEEVLVFEPAWLSYAEQIKLAGGKEKYIHYNDSVDKVEYQLTKTKLLVLKKRLIQIL